MQILTLATCTGCSACYSVCPKSAVTMSANSEGFLYPEIDNEKCIGCHKCEKVCPLIAATEPPKSLNESHAFINNNESIRYNSSSGGVFTALALKTLERGGIVFGAKFNDEFSVVHGYAADENGLESFRGSKYTQSSINQNFIKVKEFLDSGKEVLFSGTPCQIGGLKSYMSKDYANLTTVDFICHGVPSPLLWRKYISYQEQYAGAKATRTFFRRKNDGWKKFSLWFAFANHNEYCKDLTQDSYMQMFLKNVCLRKSCYDCKFKSTDRFSDITMADFWGIQNEFPELDDDKGTSFVIVHTEKGKALFDSLTDCVKKSVPLQSGLKYNPSMVKSVAMPEKRNTFFKDLNTLSFDAVIKKYAVTPWWTKCYKLARRCGGKLLKIMGLKR